MPSAETLFSRLSALDPQRHTGPKRGFGMEDGAMAHVATPTRLRMCYREYTDWVDSHTHSEWVDGEVTVFMPPTSRHDQFVAFLVTLATFVVDYRRLGRVYVAPFEMKLRAGRSYREPNLLFVASENLGRVDASRLDGPADLAVEVLSLDDPKRDLVEKYGEYEEAGIPEYWIVEGREGRSGVDFFSLGLDGRYVRMEAAADGRLHSLVLPGFWLNPAWLSSDVPPRVVDCLRQIVPEAFGVAEASR